MRKSPDVSEVIKIKKTIGKKKVQKATHFKKEDSFHISGWRKLVSQSSCCPVVDLSGLVCLCKISCYPLSDEGC